MTLDKIKNTIKSNMGNKVEIVYNGTRNKIDNYKGVIKEVYNSIFIVELDCGLNKSFSYSDLLIGVVELKNIV